MIYSAGIVVVKPVTNIWHFFMLRVRNLWDFPKGKLEPGEEFLTAARRETEEESALTDLAFDWGEVYRETEPYTKKRKKIARYYLARLVSGEPAIRPNAATGEVEHDEFAWFTYQQATARIQLPRVQAILDWACKVIGVPQC